MDDLLQQASCKLDHKAHQFAVDLINTSDLRYAHTAELGADELHHKKGVLQPLPFMARVEDGDWWETLGTCTVKPEWCLHVPNYTYLALFASSEKHFLQGCSTPSP